MSGSMFERMGGFARVRLLVSDFYDRVLESERLSPYFQSTDMRRVIDHQTKFFSAVMGGPAAFSDEQLGRVHARMHITNEEFDEMAELFRETLEDHGLADEAVERLHGHVLALRGVITGAAAAPAAAG